MGASINVRYDRDGDMLELWWSTEAGYYTATSDDRVEAHLDSDGNVQGFLVWGLSRAETPICVDLPSETITLRAAD